MTDRRKLPAASLYQVGVKESNGNVISGQARLLAAEIVISSFSKFQLIWLPMLGVCCNLQIETIK
jgi:hypothetical protein